MKMMILIMKVFNLMNYQSIAPILLESGKIRPWIEYIVKILDAQQPADSYLVQWTDDDEKIESLDKDEWWQLKGICAKNSMKLYQKYLVNVVTIKNKDESGTNRKSNVNQQ